LPAGTSVCYVAGSPWFKEIRIAMIAPFAEQCRRDGAPKDQAAVDAATSRLRPIPMAAFARKRVEL